MFPLFSMLVLGKTGEGAYARIVTFPNDNHYRLMNAMWARDLCTFSGCLISKTREKQRSKVYLTQIASALTVATVFIGVLTLIATFYSQRRRGGLYVR